MLTDPFSDSRQNLGPIISELFLFRCITNSKFSVKLRKMLKPAVVSGYFRSVSQVVSNQLNVTGQAAVLPKRKPVKIPFQGSSALSLARALPDADFTVSSGPAVSSQIR